MSIFKNWRQTHNGMFAVVYYELNVLSKGERNVNNFKDIILNWKQVLCFLYYTTSIHSLTSIHTHYPLIRVFTLYQGLFFFGITSHIFKSLCLLKYFSFQGMKASWRSFFTIFVSNFSVFIQNLYPKGCSSQSNLMEI